MLHLSVGKLAKMESVEGELNACRLLRLLQDLGNDVLFPFIFVLLAIFSLRFLCHRRKRRKSIRKKTEKQIKIEFLSALSCAVATQQDVIYYISCR